jgi:hypothetical protein
MVQPDRPQHMGAEAAVERLATLALSRKSLESVLQTVADLTKQVRPGSTEAG